MNQLCGCGPFGYGAHEDSRRSFEGLKFVAASCGRRDAYQEGELDLFSLWGANRFTYDGVTRGDQRYIVEAEMMR